VGSLAVSTEVGIAYAAALWLILIVGPATVTALKGHWMLFIAGFLTVGIVWWIAMFRLGTPESWWARRFYGDQKLARSTDRYGQ
jgi:hypothetical protein